MRKRESIEVYYGTAGRSVAPLSPIIAAMPPDIRPSPMPGCASCPAGSWSVSVQKLSCYCSARSYISWVPKVDPILLCEDREAELARLDAEDGRPG